MSDLHKRLKTSPPTNTAAFPLREQTTPHKLVETEPNASAKLSPNDHLELLIELMRPGSIELTRRWVSALMLVPESEREAVVEAVETQIVADHPD